jgi:hypothetical protein
MDLVNRRLSEPPNVDVAAFRLMGLAVVGRLASRYGIRVELRANIEGGTVAQVMLPSSIVVLPHRPIEPPNRGGRVPQLDSGPSGGGWADALRSGRGGTATATLSAIAPEPWQQPSFANGSMPGLPDPVGHPALPLMPSQRPVLPKRGDVPSPDRPQLPKRGDMVPTADRPMLPTRTAQPTETVPAAAPAPATALGSPTVAYPMVQPSASPDLQVAVGFVTPDGTKISPPPPPVSPNPSGWGAALASMPPVPPPPLASAPDEERAEAPIFLQMQASWFKGHDGTGPEDWSMPTAGYPPRPLPDTAVPAVPVAAAAAPAPVAAPPAPAPVAAPRREPTPPPARPSTTSERNDRAANGAAGSGTGQNGARPANAGYDTGGAQSVPRPRTSAEDHWRTAADEGWQRAMAAAEPPDAGTTRSGLPKRVPQAQLVPGGVQNGPRHQNRRSPDEVRGLLSAYHRGVQRGRTAGSDEAAEGAPAPKEKNQ